MVNSKDSREAPDIGIYSSGIQDEEIFKILRNEGYVELEPELKILSHTSTRFKLESQNGGPNLYATVSGLGFLTDYQKFTIEFRNIEDIKDPENLEGTKGCYFNEARENSKNPANYLIIDKNKLSQGLKSALKNFRVRSQYKKRMEGLLAIHN